MNSEGNPKSKCYLCRVEIDWSIFEFPAPDAVREVREKETEANACPTPIFIIPS